MKHLAYKKKYDSWISRMIMTAMNLYKIKKRRVRKDLKLNTYYCQFDFYRQTNANPYELNRL
jgi:hypothetical protein